MRIALLPSTLILIVCGPVSLSDVAGSPLAALQVRGASRSEPQLVIPTRREATSREAAPLSTLPVSAERIPAVTIELMIQPVRPGSTPAVKHTVSRTSQHVHFSASEGREWLFERNVHDPTRVSGVLVDHPSRTLVSYAESDLRMLMGIRGWPDVLLLGFNIDKLKEYQPTRDARVVAGVRFTRFRPASGAVASPDLWWSEAHLLAREFVNHDPNRFVRLRILQVRPGVDAGLLRQPQSRFPAYRSINVADWLEHSPR